MPQTPAYNLQMYKQQLMEQLPELPEELQLMEQLTDLQDLSHHQLAAEVLRVQTKNTHILVGMW